MNGDRPTNDRQLDQAANQNDGDSDSVDDQDQSIDETVHLTPAGLQSTTDLPDPSDQTGPSAADNRIELGEGNATHVFAGKGKTTGRAPSDAIDQTIDFSVDGMSSTPFGIGQPSADVASGDPESTIDLGSVELRPRMKSDAADRRPHPSVMESENIGQTINPRELSEKDAAFWGSIANGSGSANAPEATKMPPAVERSIHETKLQIRNRDLATPSRDPSASSDYRLVRLLGKGGMGNVYVAKQTSLDRMIAVKVIKPLSKSKRKKLDQSGRLEEVEHERRQQFLSEAVVTGDLDHPNIVPIHDIAVAEDQTLFYAMKRVQGQPWSKVINEKSRDENLEILLKACDAIAFAHTRGVVHRDIKPENIMLGDFGEVLVMDWGLALAKPEFEKKDSITATAGLGGTPAFMAPEMAIGPIEQIGPRSDVYLLGATLFYIVTGHAPHRAENVSLCIRAVASNDIVGVEPKHEGELLDIALKAMETEPEDRFESVQLFQEAIRSYRSHAESVALSTRASQHYEDAMATGKYEFYSRATFGFEQAIELWPENDAAIKNLKRLKIDHARAAYANEDFDLGLSLLNPENSHHAPLIQKLRDGQRQREQKASRLKLFRRLVAASLAFILVGGSVALYLINHQRNEAIAQRALAQDAERRALRDRDIAEIEREKTRESLAKEEQARKEADRQRVAATNNAKAAIKAKIAEEIARADADKNARIAREEADNAKQSEAKERVAKKEAEESRDIAKAATKEAQYESYLSQIGLAKARIDQNEFDSARDILKSIRNASPNPTLAWEWRWLWEQANQSSSVASMPSGVLDLAASSDGTFVIATSNDGSVVRLGVENGQVIKTADSQWSSKNREATSIAISPSGAQTAVGTELGEIHLLDSKTSTLMRRLSGHESKITDLRYLPDGRLISSSTDRSISLWNTANGQRISSSWHIAEVHNFDLAADFSNAAIVVAAVSDGRTGRAVGWRVNGNEFERLGEFKQHSSPVTAIAISPDGTYTASGDSAGNIFLWETDALTPTDYESSIQSAITKIEDENDSVGAIQSATQKTPIIAQWRAHPDRVSALQFDRTGKAIYSSSDDYTLRKWDTKDQRLTETIRGHGGWVNAFHLVDSNDDQTIDWIVSGSADGTIRTWEPGKKPTRPPRNNVSQKAITPTILASKRSQQITDTAASVSLWRSADTRTTISAATKVSQNLASAKRDQQLHQDEILAARFDRTGGRVITASRDQTARILGVDRLTMSFNELARLRINKPDAGRLAEGTDFLAMSAEVDTDGKRLFVGSADSTIRIWDLNAGTQIGQLEGTGLNNAFAISADGRRLLSGSSGDSTAIIWDVDPRRDAPKLLHRLDGPQQTVTSYALSHDGSIAITGDRNGECLTWNGTTGTKTGRPIVVQPGFRVNQLMLGNFDRSAWIATDGQQLVQFDLAKRQVMRRFNHDGFVTSFSLSSDGNQAVTVSQTTSQKGSEKELNSKATLWNVKTEKSRVIAQASSLIGIDPNGQQSPATLNTKINSARFAPQDNRILLCEQSANGRTGKVTIYDTNDRSRDSFQLPTRIGAAEQGILLGKDRMVTLNGQAAFRWNLSKRIHEKSYRSHSAVNVACFSPDGKLAATASRSVRLWNPLTGEAIDKLETPHQGIVTAMDVAMLSPANGYLIATAGSDSTAKLWKWKNRSQGFTLSQELQLTGTQVNRVRFSAKGDRLMLSGLNGTVKVMSVSAESSPISASEPVTLSLGRKLSATCSSFSADGNWIAVGATDKTAILFDLTGETTSQPIKMTGHADRIESIAIVQDASRQLRVLTASRDKSLRVWDPRLDLLKGKTSKENTTDVYQAREVLALREHTKGLTAVGCTTSGDMAMSAGRDGRVLLWPSRIGNGAPSAPVTRQ